MTDLLSDCIFDSMCRTVFPAIDDLLEDNLSECCGADIIHTDICQSCREHSSSREWDQEEIVQELVDYEDCSLSQAERIYEAYNKQRGNNE